MISLLFLSILTTFYHFCAGSIVLNFLKINTKQTYYDFSLICLFGTIFLSFIALFSNFFISLDSDFNTFIFILIIFIFLIIQNNRNYNLLFSRELFVFLIICSVGIFLFLVLSNIYRPDAGLYHYPYSNILNENKIIIGISNLHQRFGHVSILQYLNSLHFNYFFGLNGIVFPAACIAIYVITNFLSNISRLKTLSISKLFSILILFYICFKMNRYGEYGNDAIGHFTLFIIVSLYLNFREKNLAISEEKIIYLIFALSVFAFLNKTFLIFVLLTPLLISPYFTLKNILNIKMIFISFFFISWLVKNILTTGCLIYPMPITCFELAWTNFNYESNVYEVAVGSEAWAKDWSNQKNNILNYSEYLKDFIWIEFWLQNQFVEILSILIPYLAIIIIFIISLYYFKITNKKKLKGAYLFSDYFPLLSLIFFGIVIWFLKGPIYRYGYSYIISFIALFSSIILFKIFHNFEKNRLKKITNSIICLALIVLLGKQSIRIYDKYDDYYYNYPWPKFYSFEIDNRKITVKKIYKNENFLYYRSINSYCFYSSSPCTSVEVDNNLKKRRKFNYIIYYF